MKFETYNEEIINLYYLNKENFFEWFYGKNEDEIDYDDEIDYEDEFDYDIYHKEDFIRWYYGKKEDYDDDDDDLFDNIYDLIDDRED